MRHVWRLGLLVLLAGCGGRAQGVTATVNAGAGGESAGAAGPVLGAAGESPGVVESMGGTGGDSTQPPEPAGGTGGDAPVEVELTIPVTPFLIEGFEDPNNEGETAGPWLMTLHASSKGGLDGVIVSLDYASSPHEVLPDAAALHLDGSGARYSLPEGEEVTLKTYQYASDRKPGICLAHYREERPGNNQAVSQFTFFDDSGDGVADRLVLNGDLLTQGRVSAIYDDGCGVDSMPVETTGRVPAEPLALRARGDALHSTLQLENGFLTAGSASLHLPSGETVAAEPVVQGGVIYAFEAPVTLAPESQVVWRVEGTDTTEHALGPLELSVDVESWPTLADGTFENLALGTRFEGDNGRIGPQPDELLGGLAIAGGRSLILDVAPNRQRFRISRSASDTVLRFLAWGRVRVEAGALGAASAELAPLLDENADCLEYADFCDQLSEGSLRLLTYSLPPGDADVLLQLYNHAYNYGSAPEPLWIDELRVAPPPPVR